MAEHTEHQLGAIAVTRAALLRRLIVVIEDLDRHGVHSDQGVADSLAVIQVAFEGSADETHAEMVRIRAASIERLVQVLEAGVNFHTVEAGQHLAASARDDFGPGRRGPATDPPTLKN